MNEPKKRNNRVITVDTELHDKMRQHCNARGMKLHFFASEAVRLYLQNYESERLPKESGRVGQD
jgi:hypothetical protein